MKEFKNKTIEELRNLLREKREVIRGFRFAISGSKNKNIKEGREARVSVARILTQINSMNKSK